MGREKTGKTTNPASPNSFVFRNDRGAARLVRPTILRMAGY
jgi:hypothetical protein